MSIITTIKNKVLQAVHWFLHLSLIKKAILVVIIGGAGWLILPKFFGSKPKVQYQTTQVEQGSIISTLSESGNVSTVSQTSVSSTTDGIIQELYVNNGEAVVAGQKLFKVKSTATEAEKASAYASYLSALNGTKSAQQSKISSQAALEQARQAVLNAQDAVDTMNYNRTNNGGINPATKLAYTQNEMDSIQSSLTSSRTSFTAAEAKYNQSDTSIGAASASQTSAWLAYQATQDSDVIAPIDGTVANLSAVVGSNVTSSGTSSTSSSSSSSSNSSSSSSTSSTPVLIIGNFSALMIKAQINEVDIPKIHAGQKATVTLDALTDKTFVGEIANVDTIGTSSSGVVTYNAYISLISPPADIQPGMTASAVIQIARKDSALIVPSAAVQTANGSSYVRELKNGKLTQVPVEVGISSDTDTEITSGVKEGDTVVTSVVAPTTTSSASTTTSPFSGLGGTRTGAGGGFGAAGGFTGGTGARTGTRNGGTRTGGN